MANDDALTIEAVRARFPWSAEMLALGKPLEYLWHHDLSVEAADLWPQLIETSRLNRAMGLPEMRFEERNGRLHGSSVYGGLRHEWVERPWDWVAERYLYSVRTYSRGYGHQARCLFQVAPRPRGGVRLHVYFGWIPRGRLSRFFLDVGMRRVRADFDRAIPQLAGSIVRARAALLERPAPPLSADAERRLAEARAELVQRGLPARAVDALIDHIRSGDEDDLARIRVRALAERQRVPESDMLRVSLHGTRLGLLNLSWDVICPHCRGVREEARTLGELPRTAECDVCGIDFSTDKVNAIEITFHVHPGIRHVPKRFYCSAEASTKAHIAMQQHVAPGDRAAVSVPLAAGRYRLRLHGRTSYRFLELAPEAEADAGRGDAEAGPRRLVWHAGGTGDLTGRASPEIELQNDTGEGQTFIVERVAWSAMALRPARLFTLQEFRDLFSEEYLGTDVRLAVGEQTILFTDMVGSTRFYARCGDPDAFVAVKKHFEVIYEIVGRHRGAVVKTIGDAAMGAFEGPVDALRAAREIHERFAPEQRDTPIRVRISLNLGPCIAVRLNSNIDYFGSTVNLAAKLQACAGPGDIAMSRTVADAPGVSAYLETELARVEKITYRLDALDKDLEVLVWRVFPEQPGRRPGEAEIRA